MRPPWPLLGHSRRRRSPGWSGKRCNPRRAPGWGPRWRPGWRRSRGPEADKEQSSAGGERPPGPESYCPPYLRLSWTLVPSAGRRSCPSDRGQAGLFRAGTAGGARGPAGKGWAPLLHVRLWREALPYLSHRPPSRSRTCILKAPCSPGIGGGRVLRPQKLEPRRGRWAARRVDCTNSRGVPRVRPAPPTHPRGGPIGRARGGTTPGRASGWASRAGAQRGETRGPAAPRPARPLAPPPEAGPGPREPRPRRRGGWGLELGRGGPPPA